MKVKAPAQQDNNSTLTTRGASFTVAETEVTLIVHGIHGDYQHRLHSWSMVSKHRYETEAPVPIPVMSFSEEFLSRILYIESALLLPYTQKT